MKSIFTNKDYDAVMALKRPKHRNPRKPLPLLRGVIRIASVPDLLSARFTYEKHRMEGVEDEPCLILMNHSNFMDMEIAYRIFFPKPVNIVCTTDAMLGKAWLMHLIGCIPTQKFVTDVRLIQDMTYALKKLKSNVLLYPEAGYSFDGTATPLPRKMGVLLKKLDVPVVMVRTEGAFSRNPLYNCLKKRKKVKVHAHVECLFTREELRSKSVQELSDGLDAAFGFDGFRWQQETGLEINEPFRADGLERVLYKCPACGAEGKTQGKGTGLTCHACGKHYELTPQGRMEASGGVTEFPHIPDWFAWEREQVRKELLDDTYRLDTEVDIAMIVDYKTIYSVGSGRLKHDRSGFTLTGCDGRLHYTQPPLACYSVNADYYWYERGDIISIGNTDALYYCFPKDGTPVAKTRLAAEELYKLYKSRTLRPAPAGPASEAGPTAPM